MLFNSYAFLFLFWPLCWWFARQLRVRMGPRAALTALLLSSWFFYGWWQPSPDRPRFLYLPLLLASTAVNFGLGRWLVRSRGRLLLGFGIALNLGALGVFKYLDFAVATLNSLAGTRWEQPGWVLPIGISFFTFQQIAYLVECRRERGAEADALPYASFVAFFPQLIAGPIVHARELIPQFRRPGFLRPDARLLVLGLSAFFIGLAKKVLLADELAGCVHGIFDLEAEPSLGDAWGAVLAYSLQLYLDFSGYADMAIGIALTFNLRLPENFDSPYKATSIVDFWRRWHMTLSRFLRDYLYIPLGGGRCASWRRFTNLTLTMLLGGLWHGAGWTFVAWGGLHGGFLCLHHLWHRVGFTLPRLLGWALTFLAVCLAWVPFRAVSGERAGVVTRGLLGQYGTAAGASPFSLEGSDLRLVLFGLLLVTLAPSRAALLQRLPRSDLAHAGVFAALAVACVLALADPSPFLYFQF